MRTAALFFLLTAAASAQTTLQPRQQPATSTAPASPYTLKAGTQRVLVDVVVRDKHGNAVHGLHASDFTVAEDNHPQPIRDFDEHTALTSAQATSTPPLPTLPAGEFTNFVAVPPSASLNVILIDRLNTSQSDQVYLRQQLIKYLDHARPDARTAVFALLDHLVLLQGFTSDPRVLRAALEGNASSVASPLRDDALGGASSPEDLSDLANIQTRNSVSPLAVQAFQAQYQSFQSQLQGKYTLDALNTLGRALSTLPGRKNLIWFSGDFPTAIFPGDNNGDVPYAQFAGLDDEFRQTINLLSSDQVAIYPVDAGGLRNTANNSAGRSNPQYGRVESQLSRSGLAVANDTANAAGQIGVEHIGMKQIAYDTGGLAIVNTNDLSRAVDDAIANGSDFYTLSYVPPNAEDKATFRRIKVTLTGQSYSLSYRRGYYTETTNGNRVPLPGQNATPSAPSQSSLKRALLAGGPEPTELLLKVRATPVNKGGQSAVVDGNTPNPDPKKIAGPYQQFEISYAAAARAISFRRTTDNRYHADLNFVTYVYDRNGTLVNAQSNTVRTDYDPKVMLEILRNGIPFVQQVSVPENGPYTLRVAVHDNINDKVGAVEIPIGGIRKLPLVSELLPPSTSAFPLSGDPSRANRLGPPPTLPTKP